MERRNKSRQTHVLLTRDVPARAKAKYSNLRCRSWRFSFPWIICRVSFLHVVHNRVARKTSGKAHTCPYLQTRHAHGTPRGEVPLVVMLPTQRSGEILNVRGASTQRWGTDHRLLTRRITYAGGTRRDKHQRIGVQDGGKGNATRGKPTRNGGRFSSEQASHRSYVRPIDGKIALHDH